MSKDFTEQCNIYKENKDTYVIFIKSLHLNEITKEDQREIVNELRNLITNNNLTIGEIERIYYPICNKYKIKYFWLHDYFFKRAKKGIQKPKKTPKEQEKERLDRLCLKSLKMTLKKFKSSPY